MRIINQLGLGCALLAAYPATCFAQDYVPKSDMLVAIKPASCDIVIELPLDQATAYLKNCLDVGARQNAAILKAHVVQFIVWDPIHNEITCFATRRDADNQKGQNEDAVVLTADDGAFPALLDAWKYREQQHFSVANSPH